MSGGGGGGSFGRSRSSSRSNSNSVDYGTAQDPIQQQMMHNMWTNAQSIADSGAGGQYGMQGYTDSQNYLNQGMAGLGGQYMTGAQDTLSRMQNPGMDPMMDVYSRQIGQNFNEQIMPGLRGDAAVGGGLGSSRAGIAQGLAGARMGQQLQDFGAQLYGQNQDRAMQAAGMQGQLQQGISGMYGQASDAAQRLGQYGMGIPWYGQQQMAGLLGPAIMRDLGGSSWSKSRGKGSSLNISAWGGG